ncbi:D-tyrosyl-tRNA(Tyr) deacylase [Dispira simplex]|nr:D-tyrosyl-tRNA(Tyr) deacylase [Dispira simplex]
MPSQTSKVFYELFLEKLRSAYKPDKIQDGRFGAMMSVNIQNDGPVTILLDSHKPSTA